MKSILALVLAISCAVVLAADNDEKCKNDFHSFLSCVKTQHDQKPESEKEAAKKARQDKSNQCFSQAGCDAPDWESDPTGGAGKHGKGGKGGFDMSPAVKQCLKKKMIEKIGTKLNECLSKKGVKNVNFSALAEGAEHAGLGIEGEGHGGAGKEGFQGSLKAKFNVVKAVDKCSQKKGGDTNSVKPLEQCLHNVKKEERPKVCAAIKPCEDKVSKDCKKRGQEIKTAICQCTKEKEKEISNKLRALGQSQQKVGIQDLIKTVADDQDMQDVSKQLEACYAEAGEAEPPLLKLALQFFSRGGGGGAAGGKFGAAMSVNGSTVIIMSDMMEIDANDQSECQPCK